MNTVKSVSVVKYCVSTRKKRYINVIILKNIVKVSRFIVPLSH